MMRASHQFTEQQRQAINQAVAEAESKTAAEIVPVVAAASGRYERSEDIVGLWTGILLMFLIWAILPEPVRAAGTWDGITPGWKFFWMLIALVGGFLVGTTAAGYRWQLRWWFTPAAQMAAEVTHRARLAFYDATVHQTGGGTGLLIYISLFERRAAVLGDDAILERLGQQALDDLCSELTAKLRSGDLTHALCDTIADAGKTLARALPRQPDTQNELPDTLVLLDEV
ncbi:MAG: hypothetical protein WD079_00740 [Phycisphaeraceae bacterium]